MGVPSFYSWLVKKYPKVVSDAAKGDPSTDMMKFDNFYLDMNGIIHACFHPDDDVSLPTTFDEVFARMHEYIDSLFDIVRPQKLLFLAIDGVAPRAKMNQQRARRFRSSKDVQIAEEIEMKLRQEFEKEGKALLPKNESQLSDSNVITPGTEFMHILSEDLQIYIRQRVSQNHAWGSIKVILSDDKVPGEGEHKIMTFIRAQRSLPDYDPNTRHCLYGLDADLIMLALATHEIHFSILREEVLPSATNQSSTASEAVDSLPQSVSGKLVSTCKESNWAVNKKKRYQFLNVWVLREYLALDMDVTSSDNDLDLERVVDDFIFICFLSGNDFLPHLPSLEIHEACIDLLMHIYKNEFKTLGGYLVDAQRVQDNTGGYINLKRVERFMILVGTYEEKIFTKRCEVRDRKLKRIIAEHQDAREDESNAIEEGISSDIVFYASNMSEYLQSTSVTGPEDVYKNMEDLKQKLKDTLRKQSDLFKDGVFGSDGVKFGKDGWKERYYRVKFNAQSSAEAEATRKSVVMKYGEGLFWCFLYYFAGVPSWTWFYPYHYGPLLSDCKGVSQTKVKFQKGMPFNPFEQLMAVLPPLSAHAVPMAYRGLMTDPNSVIHDFYPTEFEVDMDGKRFTWQGICKLPFIEEERLLAETRKLEIELKDDEKVRNLKSLNHLFLRLSQQSDLDYRSAKVSEKIKGAYAINCTIKGIAGVVHMMPDNCSVDASVEDVTHMFFEVREDCKHVPRLLEGVNVPEKIVCEEDILETILWHEGSGRSSSNMNRCRTRHNHKSDSMSFPSAGCGFALGRGKSNVAEFRPAIPTMVCGHREQLISSNQAPVAAKDYKGTPSSGRKQFVPRYENRERSKMEYCGRMEYRQISETRQHHAAQKEPMHANTSFWPSNTIPNEDRRLPKVWRNASSMEYCGRMEYRQISETRQHHAAHKEPMHANSSFWPSNTIPNEDRRLPKVWRDASSMQSQVVDQSLTHKMSCLMESANEGGKPMRDNRQMNVRNDKNAQTYPVDQRSNCKPMRDNRQMNVRNDKNAQTYPADQRSNCSQKKRRNKNKDKEVLAWSDED